MTATRRMSKTYKSNTRDFEYAIKLTRLLLLPLGLWPTESETYRNFVRPVAIALCLFSKLFVIVPLCLFIFLAVKDLRIRLKLVAPLGFGLMCLFKYVVVILKEREISSCFANILLDWQAVRGMRERQVMMENVKTVRALTILCVVFVFSSGMPYLTVLPLTKPTVMRGNVTLRSLAYPSYFIFFNPQVRPVYDFVFMAHFMCGVLRYTVISGVYSIAIVCVFHICSQVSITTMSIKKLNENFNKQLFSEVVIRHMRFLKFASELEGIFNKICMVEMLGSTFIICFVGYYLITEYEGREVMTIGTYFLQLVSSLFNIFLLCNLGEILTEQCHSIGTSAYMINWYRLSAQEARNVVLLVVSTQRPVVLTAGKMANLSVQSFANVIKASASYLNLLRTVTANST